MPLIIKKKNNAQFLFRAFCPHCKKYRAVTQLRQSVCKGCYTKFPPETRGALDIISARLKYYMRDKNGNITN